MINSEAVINAFAKIRKSSDTFPKITETCDADSRTNSKIGKLNIFLVAEWYEEVFGKEESNV